MYRSTTQGVDEISPLNILCLSKEKSKASVCLRLNYARRNKFKEPPKSNTDDLKHIINLYFNFNYYLGYA